MMAASEEAQLPEQKIGYNLLLDVTQFKMQGTFAQYGTGEARWAGTDEFIPINPNYTYNVGSFNTKYYVYWFDSNKTQVYRTVTGFWGGALAIPDPSARYVQVVWGVTDANVEEFRSTSYFKRET